MNKVLKIYLNSIQKRSIVKCTSLLHRVENTEKSAASDMEKQEVMKTESMPDLGTPKRIRENPAFMKIDTPEFRSIFTEELNNLIAIFKKYNYEIRIAGGAVRDLLMHIKPKDIDLATTATPTEMKEFFIAENIRLINENGESHGTITPRIGDENFEVTTLRVDVITDGRHAKVKYTTNWQLDANRRDLTINSMFLDFDGTVYDYFFGYDDLMQRRVVFVGDAAKRIQEDYLRILRYFRFYGRIAEKPNNHDQATLNAIRDNADGLRRISGERIWSELQRILVGNFAADIMLQMIKCGLATGIGLPEVPNLKEFERFCSVMENFTNPSAISYMAALINTPEEAVRLHERLKFSKFERECLYFLVAERDKVDMEYKLVLDFQKLCMQPPAVRQYVEELLKYTNKKDFYEQIKLWKMPKFPLSGVILKQHGCPSGEKMGTIISRLRSIWAESNFTLSDSDLLENYYPDVLKDVVESSPSFRKRKHK